MTVEEAIRARVASLAPVVALVGARVYLLIFPQKPMYPAIRVQLIDDVEGQHLRGPDGLLVARIQIDMHAKESTSGGNDVYADAVALAAAVKGDGLGTSASGIAGWKGTVGGVRISNCKPDGRRSGYVPDEFRVVFISQDFLVSFYA